MCGVVVRRSAVSESSRDSEVGREGEDDIDSDEMGWLAGEACEVAAAVPPLWGVEKPLSLWAIGTQSR
jgi:hypothetical protein